MKKQGSCLEKEIMQGTMPGACWRGRPHTAWMDNIKTWTGLPMEESVRMTEDRDKWRKYIHGVANPRIEDGWRNRTEQLVYEHTIYFRFHSQKQHRRQSRGAQAPQWRGCGGTMHSGPPTLTPVDRNKAYCFHVLVLNLPAPLDI